MNTTSNTPAVLSTPADLPELRLKRGEDRRLAAGHLWVFSNEVDTARTPLTAFQPGALCRVVSDRDRFLGYAYVNPHSLISARILGRSAAHPPDKSLFVHRLQVAQSLRRRLYDAPWLHRWAIVMAPSGLIALLAGWFVTEVGRQPYLVYGLLRTADGASPVGAPGVAGSLLGFVVVYLFVFGAGIFYMIRLAGRPTAAPAELALQEGPIRTAGITPGPAQGEGRGRSGQGVEFPQ